MSNFSQLTNVEKPREKMMIQGVKSLTDAELLAIILQSGSRNESVVNLSQKLLEKYDGLTGVFESDIEELKTNQGIGSVKALKLKAILQINKKISQGLKQPMEYVKNPEDVFELVKEIKDENQEHLVLICLDNKSRLISKSTIYVGTVDEITIHPREIFNEAIKNRCYCMIVVHNHPSGDVNPSQADIESTERLVKISHVVGINFLDHIIVGKNDYYSIRENNAKIFN